MVNHGRTWSHTRLFLKLLACWLCCGTLAWTSSLNAAEPSPIQDDATLRDIAMIGEKLAWAVGDHGVMWKTTDSGATWKFVPTNTLAHWNSVCFLSDRVGWVAGGDTEPFTRRGRGLLLVTKDGGVTWQAMSNEELPRLRYVRFFDPRQGVIVGEPNAAHPSGVLFTEDGGKTWQEMAGPAGSSWLAADFVEPLDGLLGGRQGRVSAVSDGKVLPARVDPSSWRRIHAVRLQRDLQGWLVGDGGLVMKTETGGVVWEAPAGELPKELRDAANFRAVAAHGDQAWIAGSPGSVIWYSPNGGQSWQRQLTGSSLPIESLEFANANNGTDSRVGIAVGACGMILQTMDGGETWRGVRGADRRAGYLSVSVWPEDVSFRLMAQQSGEQGYRSLATVLVPEVRADKVASTELDQYLLDAVHASGGNCAETDERWMSTIPDLAKQPEKLLEAWSRRAEGRLNEQWLARWVVTIRSWRPDVVVVGGETDDAVEKHLRASLLRAVEIAADPTQSPWLTEVFALPAWKVSKVYARRSDGSAGEMMLESHELLARLGVSIAQAAAPSEGRLLGDNLGLRTRSEAYRLLKDETSTGGTFWRGIVHAGESASRRRMLEVNERDLEQRQKSVRRQKNFVASAERAVTSESRSAALLAELRTNTREMPPSQAAVTLAQLAVDLQQHGQADSAEATLIELVDRYGDEPAAQSAMSELIRTWCSAEMSWRRLKKTEVVQQTTKAASRSSAEMPSDPLAALRQSVPMARPAPRSESELLQVSAKESAIPKIDTPLSAASTTETNRGPLKFGSESTWDRGQLEHWQQQALKLAKRLRERSPEMADQPSVQFSLAAMLRQRGSPDLAAAIYRRFEQSAAVTPWRRVARRELWLQRPIGEQPDEWFRSMPARTKPHLDGDLSDDCWQNVKRLELRETDVDSQQQAERALAEDEPDLEVPAPKRSRVVLASGDDSTPQKAFAMITHDERYLYFAASLPRHLKMPGTELVRDGRTHDADLSGFDRVSLFVDIDRDYSVCDLFEIDQRGCTRESCGGDLRWNPKWYVVTASTADRWTLEAAIPLSELAPPELRRGVTWTIGVVRTLPAISASGWPALGNQSSEPVWRGLLKLE